MTVTQPNIINSRETLWNLSVESIARMQFDGSPKTYLMVLATCINSGLRKYIYLNEEDPHNPKITCYELDKYQLSGVNEGIIKLIESRRCMPYTVTSRRHGR